MADSAVSWILAGLGNPGRKYEHTRHNMGFLTLDLLAERQQVRLRRIRFQALCEIFRFGGARCLAMKPQTFMNLSGEAVREAAQFYKIPPERVLVIYDDVSLPVGKIRVRSSGSAGGHNGIKNIIAHLGTEQFPRVKIGVGEPATAHEEGLIDWVTGVPPLSERKVLLESCQRAVEAAECIIEEDGNCQKAMNRFN